MLFILLILEIIERNSAKNFDNINFSEEIDYYFFTDMDIQSSKWNVQKVTLKKNDFGGKTCPMTKYRHTSKKYKFCYLKYYLHMIMLFGVIRNHYET